MQCAYCGVTQPWDRDHFPSTIYAECFDCIVRQYQDALAAWQACPRWRWLRWRALELRWEEAGRRLEAAVAVGTRGPADLARVLRGPGDG